MKKGQIFMVSLNRSDKKIDPNLQKYSPAILMQDSNLPEATPATVIIIPIAQDEESIKGNRIEISPKILEENLGEITGIAVVDGIRTIHENSIQKELMGSLSSEGIKLIDKAVLSHLGSEIPE